MTEEKNKVVGGMLYLVSTPIGNLADMSERALKVLGQVDFIAAEDTRNTLKLLRAFGISKPMVSYHQHNRAEMGERIAERLESGESCALVTDAGTPAISDPGEDLVVLCAERGIPVTAVPGACAFITALALSALPTAKFVFEGFLPVGNKERREILSSLSQERRTVIFHEAPHKLKKTLADLGTYFGADRRISLCRELTKLNEQILRTTVGEAIDYYENTEPKGEYVLVLDGYSGETKSESVMTPEAAVAYYEEQGMSRNEAIKAAAKQLGISRNELYKTMLEKA